LRFTLEAGQAVVVGGDVPMPPLPMSATMS